MVGQGNVLSVRFPLRTSLPFFVMVQMFLSKYASQPSSYSFPTEYREPDSKEKKMWASRAFLKNMMELDFVGGNTLRDASVWGHAVDSYVEFSDVFNIYLFQKTVCCRPGVNYIYKISFFRYNI